MSFNLTESFPPAARRWLENVLPAGFETPSRIQISQTGEMDIRGKWTPFTALGIYQGDPFTFNWQARLALRRGLWIIAEDGHDGRQGWGGARLWGILPMGRRTDSEVLTTQRVRNIGELAWLPELAIIDDYLSWRDAGDNAFEVALNTSNDDVQVRFDVDETGNITHATSSSRPYDVPGGYDQAPWHYQFSDHRQFGGVLIPAKAVATYELDDGPWEYFRCQIVDVNRD